MSNFSQRIFKNQIIILLVLILSSGFIVSSNYWKFDDDHIVIFLTGRAIISGKEIENRFDEVLAVLETSEFRQDGIEDIMVRRSNIRTYLLPSFIYAMTSEIVDISGLASRQADYGLHLIVSSILGYILPFIIAASLAVYTILSTEIGLRRKAIVTLGVLIAALLFLDAEKLVLTEDWLDRILPTILNPGAAFGIFGITARCNVVLIAFSVFILRISNRYCLGYCAALVAILFHRQQGALLFVMLISADLIMRPGLLTQPRILFCIVPALSYFASMETFWPQIGVSPVLGLSIVIGLAGVSLLAALLYRRSGRGNENEEFFGTTSRGLWGLGRIMRDDRSVFLLIFLSVLTVSHIAVSARLGGNWFWMLLPGRFLILLQPLLALSIVQICIFLVPSELVQRRILRWSVHGIFVAAVLTLCVVGAQGTNDLIRRALYHAGTAEWFEDLAPLGISSRVSYRDEEHIYYAIVNSVDTNSDLFERLIEGTRQPTIAKAIAHDDERTFRRLLEQGVELNDPVSMIAPREWPIRTLKVTPLEGAIIWKRESMASALRERLAQ